MTTMRLSNELMRQVKSLARKENRSIANCVETLIESGLKLIKRRDAQKGSADIFD